MHTVGVLLKRRTILRLVGVAGVVIVISGTGSTEMRGLRVAAAPITAPIVRTSRNSTGVEVVRHDTRGVVVEGALIRALWCLRPSGPRRVGIS